MSDSSISFSTKEYDVTFCINGFQTYDDSSTARWCDMYVTVKNDIMEETVGGEEICSDEVFSLFLFLEGVLEGTAIDSEYNPMRLFEEPWTFTAVEEDDCILTFLIPINDTSGKYRYCAERRVLRLDKPAVEKLRDYLKEMTREQDLLDED